jgi:hypothetical protein
VGMQRPPLEHLIDRLVRAGEQAGLSVADMIQILNAGVSVEILFNLIERNLQSAQTATGRSSRYV